MHFISFIAVQDGVFQNIKSSFNFWSWDHFLALTERFLNLIFTIAVVLLFFNLRFLIETKFFYDVTFSYFRSSWYNIIIWTYYALSRTSSDTINGSVDLNWFKFSWSSLNESSEPAMVACWTSDLIPAFLKQQKTVFVVTASQESAIVFIACKIEIFG